MRLDYKNSNINYTITGKGPTVVLLHGFLESIVMWDEILSELSKKHQVFCVDLLGHGQTDCLGYVHTMEAMADAVWAVLTHHKVEEAHFIGHSMGGYVALALAENEPERFKSLCLMNSTFEADNAERKLLRKRANKMAQTNYKNLIRMSFANLFAPKSRIVFKQAYEEALQLALQTPVQGYIAAQDGMSLRPNRFEVFKGLKGKKAIIIGKKDALINGDEIKSQIKTTNIDFKELSEGHMSHIENYTELSYFLKHLIEK